MLFFPSSHTKILFSLQEIKEAMRELKMETSQGDFERINVRIF